MLSFNQIKSTSFQCKLHCSPLKDGKMVPSFIKGIKAHKYNLKKEFIWLLLIYFVSVNTALGVCGGVAGLRLMLSKSVILLCPLESPRLLST